MRPNRKRMRLAGWDYSAEGAYFLTICTKNRKAIFSRIVRRDIPDAPEIQLSHYGHMVEDAITYLSDHANGLIFHNWVIMPNHVHLLISVTNEAMVTKGVSGKSRPTEAIIPRMVSSLKRFTNKNAGFDLWQDSYYDHIIRDDEDFLCRWQYIDNNPYAWMEDDYYTDSE